MTKTDDHHSGGLARPGTGSVRRFRTWLLVLVGVGAAVRLVAVGVVGPEVPLEHGDAAFYHGQAEAIADGAWFVEPFIYESIGVEVDDANHPPLYSLVLAAPASIGADTVRANQLVNVLIGTAAIAVIGLLGRRLGGDRTGLVAAALATLYPAIWAHEALVLSETLVVLLTAAVLLSAYRFRDAPSVGRAAACSALVALLALTRSEFLFLAPLLVLPLIGRSSTGIRRWRALGAAAAVGLVLIGPWMAWNTARFGEPVAMSHQLGQTLAAANCQGPYEDPDNLGYIDYRCIVDPVEPGWTLHDAAENYDPVRFDHENREVAFEYIGDHRSRLPVVVAARIGRAWEFYGPAQQVRLHENVQNRPSFVAWTTVWLLYPLVALATMGVVLLRRRGEVVWPMMVFVSLTTVVAAITFGSVRYRAGSDVVVVLLAAVVLAAAWDQWRTRSAVSPKPVP